MPPATSARHCARNEPNRRYRALDLSGLVPITCEPSVLTSRAKVPLGAASGYPWMEPVFTAVSCACQIPAVPPLLPRYVAQRAVSFAGVRKTLTVCMLADW